MFSAYFFLFPQLQIPYYSYHDVLMTSYKKTNIKLRANVSRDSNNKISREKKSREYEVKEGKIEIAIITVIVIIIIIMLMTKQHELLDLKTSQRTIKIRLKKLHKAL